MITQKDFNDLIHDYEYGDSYMDETVAEIFSKAKQLAIGFGDWLKTHSEYSSEDGDWYKDAFSGGVIYTTEQLFELYLKSYQ